jgi:hypothetical protein
VTLGELFSSAVFGPETADIEVLLPSKAQASQKLQCKTLSTQVDKNINPKEFEKLEKEVFSGANLVKNGPQASAGDFLQKYLNFVFLHAQCKISTVSAAIGFSKILDEIAKNIALSEALNAGRAAPVRLSGVSLFLIAQQIEDIPEYPGHLPNRTIIVHSPQIDEFFGPMSRLRFLFEVSGIVAINEMGESALRNCSTAGIATAIAEYRKSKSFSSSQDLENYLRSQRSLRASDITALLLKQLLF